MVSSVTVSSSAGGSSYPDRETLAEASKNCFQNFWATERLAMLRKLKVVGLLWSSPRRSWNVPRTAQQQEGCSSLRFDGRG